MRTADDYIKLFNMLPHPEGGYYATCYRSENRIVPDSKGQSRALYSSIYYLFREGSISALHQLRSDEIWHWHDGDTIEVAEIDEAGILTETRLGLEPGVFQHRISAGTWFGGKTSGSKGFALMGCTVHPGFDFADFELGERKFLLSVYPQHAQIIEALTLK